MPQVSTECSRILHRADAIRVHLNVCWCCDSKSDTQLAWVSSKFKRLTWIGFTSNADAKTVFYLDDFVLEAFRAKLP